MSSPKLERAKQRNPGLSALLGRVATYIGDQVRAGQTYIVPKLAAASLRLSDGEAFVLLELLAKADLIERVYNIYCRDTDILLATVDDPEALDSLPHCDECDSDHSPGDLRVQIAFRPKGRELTDFPSK